MRPGLFAFAAVSAFLGASLYINIVEQPARSKLNPEAMIREWTPSNRRGLIMLAVLAAISAVLAYADYANGGDTLWILGGTLILMCWLYAYFVMGPVTIWLYAMPPRAASTVRELIRDWGLLEWGQTVIGVGAWCIFAWALVLSD